jgi:hypothetical protein
VHGAHKFLFEDFPRMHREDSIFRHLKAPLNISDDNPQSQPNMRSLDPTENRFGIDH